MKSKERVLKTLKFEETDRVPMGLFGTFDNYINKLIYHYKVNNLKECYEILGIDIYHFWTPLIYAGEQRYYKGEKADYWGITENVYKDGDSSNECPLIDVSSIDEVEKYSWPTAKDFIVGDFENQLEYYSDFCIDGGLFAPIFHNVTWLCGFENTLVNLLLQPEVSKALIRKITDFWVEYAKKMLEFGKGRIDIVQTCNDFGTQNGLIMSADTFREFFKPELKRIYDVIKEYGAKVMQHSCGSISEIIPDFIEIGADIINPVQVSAKGMEIEKLSEQFGGKVCFYGGIDTQHVLPEGSEEEIREIVRDTLTRFNGKEDIPIENAIAMFDEGKKVVL